MLFCPVDVSDKLHHDLNRAEFMSRFKSGSNGGSGGIQDTKLPFHCF